MQPPMPLPAKPRGVADRLAVTFMIVALLVVIAVLALIAVYMNRVGKAVADLPRMSALPNYPGRPGPVVVDGASPENYLVMTTISDTGELSAVMIGHLSGTKREFTLVGLPSDLRVTTADGRQSTLAQAFHQDRVLAARSVEGLLGIRMDHQVHLDLGRFVGVVDALDGLDVDSAERDGRETVAHLAGSADAAQRVTRTMDVVRATLVRLSQAGLIANPNRFDAVMSALTPCIIVDSDLTSTEIEETTVDLQVRGDRIGAITLDTYPAADGDSRVADAAHLARLSKALAADTVADLVPGR